tara:strand:+ start:1868 stop:2026 length:159 start_codon:yes stop_codon:yes gene_type:complete
MKNTAPSNVQPKHIDLILRIIRNSKNIHGAELDLLVETIQELQKLKLEKKIK